MTKEELKKDIEEETKEKEAEQLKKDTDKSLKPFERVFIS